MEGDNNSAVPLTGLATEAAEPQVFPASEAAVEVAVGLEEKLNSVRDGGGHLGVAVSGSGVEAELTAKRKRGRPRKEPVAEFRHEFTVVPPESSASPIKRGRGRPRGTGKWQTLAASLGGTALESSGSNFTPHTIPIQTGENIVERIYTFSQRSSESMCILSASGTVSSAEIMRPGSCGSIMRYEGRFDIVSLMGSHTNNGVGGGRGKICLLSVQLASSDGNLFGGAVAGSLVAGGPTQLVIATFRQNRAPVAVRHFIDPSKPKKEALAASSSSHAVNGRPQGTHDEINRLTIVSHVTAPTLDGVDQVTSEPDANQASSQPFNWNTLQPCSTNMSQHLISDVNTDNTDHE